MKTTTRGRRQAPTQNVSLRATEAEQAAWFAAADARRMALSEWMREQLNAAVAPAHAPKTEPAPAQT